MALHIRSISISYPLHIHSISVAFSSGSPDQNVLNDPDADPDPSPDHVHGKSKTLTKTSINEKNVVTICLYFNQGFTDVLPFFEEDTYPFLRTGSLSDVVPDQ